MSTRLRLLEATEHLVSARGYADVAMKDIASMVGIKAAAIFYHFPTKAELVIAALDESSLRQSERFSELEQEIASPIERIRAFSREFGKQKRTSMEFCIAGGLAAGVTALPAEVQAAVGRYRAAEEAWFCKQIGSAYPDLSPGEVTDRAVGLVAMLQGALLVTRMGNDPAAFDRVLDVLEPPLLDP